MERVAEARRRMDDARGGGTLLPAALKAERELTPAVAASLHGRLADFRVAAAPYARSAAVREFDTKHRDLVGASLT